MNAETGARQAAARTGRLIGRHKVISASVAVFAAAIIAVSLATSGSAAQSPKTYRNAPNFSLAALGSSSEKISLRQYAGKPVIVNFFASWCEPCQRETPLLASWYKQQHGKVVLIGLDGGDTLAHAQKFVAAKGVTYPVAFDPNTTAATAYDLVGYPETAFLNAKHQIVYWVVGAATQAKLDKGLSLTESTS
jgi:cytochrome c biogenesis protein CcmG/thiol:disulfide interchange protein DsbE